MVVALRPSMFTGPVFTLLIELVSQSINANIIIRYIHIHGCKSTGNAVVRSSSTHFGWRTMADGDIWLQRFPTSVSDIFQSFFLETWTPQGHKEGFRGDIMVRTSGCVIPESRGKFS